ncbi:HAD family hydrolase [Sphingomonas turrisvirgatae]|uniref:HAD family hydrolase n=1 Tax=Sphingomonas turrisvirgatae TaxID=1888892 RepID=UPI0009A19707|nr:HAD-IA family hydrolase [Sphingomonas turrisvirgatae]
MNALIIDLDDTAVDTSALREFRDRRDWKGSVKNLHKTVIFPGMKEALDQLRGDGVRVGFVTASVSFYAEKVLRQHALNYDCLISYHDCSPRKPHPAPIEMCLSRLGCSSVDALGIGDSAVDAEAYRRAEMRSVGAGWSSVLERGAGWDIIASAPNDLLTYIR